MNDFNPQTFEPKQVDEMLLKSIALFDKNLAEDVIPTKRVELLLKYIATHQVSGGDVSGVLEAAKAYADGLNDETVKTLSEAKVDKEEGKGLSTEDFTTFYKEKLDNLEAISAQIVDELPETGDKNCYYFVPDNQSEGTNNDFYVTFMYFETLGWKTIGTTRIDLKDYVTFAHLYENNYNKVETDSKLQTKANVSDVYTKTQVDTALALKANSADVYTKTEADEKFQTKLQILTQEEYDALVTAGTVDTNTTYLIKSDL